MSWAISNERHSRAVAARIGAVYSFRINPFKNEGRYRAIGGGPRIFSFRMRAFAVASLWRSASFAPTRLGKHRELAAST